MEKKSKILTFIASDKYFKVWLVFCYFFAICFALYVVNTDRSKETNNFLEVILALLPPVFFLGLALRKKIPAKYKEEEECEIKFGDNYNEEYNDTTQVGLKENTKVSKKPEKTSFVKNNKIKFIIGALVVNAIIVQLLLLFADVIDIDMIQNIYVAVLISACFIYNLRKKK